jgi:histidyl-tRNA synthetase
MPKKPDLSIPKGTRDFMPQEMIVRQEVLDSIRSVFEIYGFSPLETPVLENFDILSAKGAGGSEILKETYNFEDKGGRMIGLRYDLTVPLSRVVAMNPNLTLPFKRYQIANVWRYGDITKGRLREFWQADIDIVGSDSMLADAEIIACASSALEKLGFKNFVVRLNNRKILSALIKYAGVDEEKVLEAFKAIDKLEKVGLKGVENELSGRGVSSVQIKKIMEFIKIQGKPEEVLKKSEKLVKDFEEGKQGVEELKQVVGYLKKMGFKSGLKIDFSLARGLDYYTGPIFEVFAEEGIGSLAGGGRFDKMIGLFSGKDLPATGVSLGIERIIEVMKERKMIKAKKSRTKAFVADVNQTAFDKKLEIVNILRKNGVSVDFDLRERSLTRQLEYADSLNIPYVVIIGPKELEKDVVLVRDMEKRKESKVKLSKIIDFFEISK